MYNKIYKLNVRNKFNILTLPKQGCTQIGIIISDINGYFDNHGHSWENGFCDTNQNIHNCMDRNSSFNKSQKTYMFSRKIEEKILSYYLANYAYMQNNHDKKYKNLSFYDFVQNLDFFTKKDFGHIGHMDPFIKSNEIEILDLDNFFTTFQGLLNDYEIDYKIKNNIISNNTKNRIKKGHLLSDTPFDIKFYDIENYKLDRNLFFTDDIMDMIYNFYGDDKKYYIS